MSARTKPLHSPAELILVAADPTTGIVSFQAASKSHPAQPNIVNLDTITGAIHCECKGAQCDKQCWHMDHVAAAWLASPAMQEVRWLTDDQLIRYGRKVAAMAAIYRGRTGRVLALDALNLVAARAEWRRRAAAAPVVADLPLAA